MGLSVPALVLSAVTTNQVCPESVDLADLATTVSLLLFCSQAAYTVLRSVGSTAICASNWPEPAGAIGRGGCQLEPLSLLTTRIMVGSGQVGQSRGTVTYCGERM